ncbi:hypothetical protein C355_04288 [Cryptococcus neoformans Th84]|nr:hypothetical protein C355_04288 [Cryptococcus neoformans var. grubii Th84]
MGRTYRIYLAGESVLMCRHCGNHLAVSEGIISKHTVVNTYSGEAEDREMRTGRHTVRDIYCRVCHTTLGWKYDFAFEHDQKYKEGKYILEREMITEKPERRDIISGKPRIEEIPIREILARV